MIPDAECVRIVFEILSQLDLGSFVIKVSIVLCVYIYTVFFKGESTCYFS